MPFVYVVQIQFCDEFIFFLTEDEARRKVDELRRESRELYPTLEDDDGVRWRFMAVEVGQLWWPEQFEDHA